MLSIAIALMLSQSDAPPNDPWDRNVSPLVVDDKIKSGEPSFVAVSICVGSDMDSRPVLLLNRICLNEEAASVIMAESKACEQQEKADAIAAVASNQAISRLKEANRDTIVLGAIVSFVLGLAAFFSGLFLSRRP